MFDDDLIAAEAREEVLRKIMMEARGEIIEEEIPRTDYRVFHMCNHCCSQYRECITKVLPQDRLSRIPYRATIIELVDYRETHVFDSYSTSL